MRGRKGEVQIRLKVYSSYRRMKIEKEREREREGEHERERPYIQFPQFSQRWEHLQLCAKQ